MTDSISLGLRLHDTKDGTFEERLACAKKQGFSCIHLALSKIQGLTADPEALTPGYARYIRHALDDAGLDLAVLGCYLNLGNPDAREMTKIQAKYRAHIRFASFLGEGIVGTETGCPNTTYTFDKEACRSETALEHFIDNLRPIVREAEKWGVMLAIEPVARHIVWNPERARCVLDSVGSENLGIILDPVNLLDADNVSRADEVFAEAIDLLGSHVCVLHLKDYVVEEGGIRSVGCGQGQMDYTRILRFAKEKKPHIQATFENTKPDNAGTCREYIETCLQGL